MRPSILQAILKRLAPLLALLLFQTHGVAQPVASVTDCAKLMSFGIYDKYDNMWDELRFRQIQSYLKEHEFSNSSEASQWGAGLGLDIVDLFSVNLNGNSSSTNWKQWVHDLETMSFDQFLSASHSATSVRTVSKEITSLVKSCIEHINTDGLYGWIELSDNKKYYTYRVKYLHSGDTTFTKIKTLTFTPPAAKKNCDSQQLALFAQGKLISPGTLSLSCARDPGDNIQIALNTSDSGVVSDLPAYKAPNPSATFSASPSIIQAGSAAKLNWSTEGADKSVSIAPNVGSVGPEGSLPISPSTTTTYTLTATGAGGTTSRNATITVNQPLMIQSLVALFSTNDDDKDSGDCLAEQYTLLPSGGATILGSNSNWGCDLTFRERDPRNWGQTFSSLSVPLSDCGKIVYSLSMSNDKGWNTGITINAKLSDGRTIEIGWAYWNIGKGQATAQSFTMNRCP
jgi:hypothetical protein